MPLFLGRFPWWRGKCLNNTSSSSPSPSLLLSPSPSSSSSSMAFDVFRSFVRSFSFFFQFLQPPLPQRGPADTGASPRALAALLVAAKIEKLSGDTGHKIWKFEEGVKSVSNSNLHRFRPWFDAGFKLNLTLVSNSIWHRFRIQFDASFYVNLTMVSISFWYSFR